MTTFANVRILLATDGGEVAQGETTGTTEELATEGEKDNNFFYGDINEVIWGAVAFGIIFALFLWKGVAPIKRAMAKRSARIADQIAQAEATKAAAEAELASLRTSLGNAAEEAARIVADARERAVIVRADLINRADADIAEAKQRARVEIEASKSQALADLREEVVAMTLKATEAVVSSNLTGAVQAQLVDQYIDQVGAGR